LLVAAADFAASSAAAAVMNWTLKPDPTADGLFCVTFKLFALQLIDNISSREE
jgi:hypothetical protein